MARTGKELFVWVVGLKGPAPQIWPNGIMTKDQKPLKPLQQHSMTDLDCTLSLDHLAEKYPFQKTPDDPPIVLPAAPKPAFYDGAS